MIENEAEKALKPCPFCGMVAHLEIAEPHTHTLATFMPDSPGYVCISCSSCSASIIENGQDIESAISAWNTRTAERLAKIGALEEVKRKTELKKDDYYADEGTLGMNAAYDSVIDDVDSMIAELKEANR